MNCKGNELAIIKTRPSQHGSEHYGKIVFITTLNPDAGADRGHFWNYEGALFNPKGERYESIKDSALKPVGNPDEDAIDETLTWKCGKPPAIDVIPANKINQKEKINA
jgi:hypothetical protein